MPGCDFEAAALMGAASEAVKLAGRDGVDGRNAEPPEQPARSAEGFDLRLAAVGHGQDVDVATRINLVGVCVCFLHKPISGRLKASNRKGAAREHVTPCD